MNDDLIKKIESLNQLNCFELFNIPATFTINEQLVNENYLQLQKKYHPDNFIVNNSDLMNSILQLSSHINDCLRVIQSPTLRAIELLKLQGYSVDITTINNTMTQDFLIQQITINESIENALLHKNLKKITELKNTILAKQQIIINEINELFTKNQLSLIYDKIILLNFTIRLNEKIEHAYEILLTS